MSPSPGRPAAAPFSVRWGLPALLAVVPLLAGGGLWATASATTDARPIPAPALDEPAGQRTSEVAVLAGGCFWGMQGVFQHVAGVTRAVSGYDGGSEANSPLRDRQHRRDRPCGIRAITFDPRANQLRPPPADLFLRGPRPDGAQPSGAGCPARSTARQSSRKARSRPASRRPISRSSPGACVQRRSSPASSRARCSIRPRLSPELSDRAPRQPYIVVNDLPKLAGLKRVFATLYRPDPVLVALADVSR